MIKYNKVYRFKFKKAEDGYTYCVPYPDAFICREELQEFFNEPNWNNFEDELWLCFSLKKPRGIKAYPQPFLGTMSIGRFMFACTLDEIMEDTYNLTGDSSIKTEIWCWAERYKDE